jgi:hypothetical protein
MDRRVDFLIGGVQKGGTTALYEYLKRDLPVSLAKVKEAHFFDDEVVSWSDPNYGIYHNLFDAGDARPRGEVTPIYLYWPNALERIAAYNPDVRLIFIFRDPIQRAWSHWRMETQRGFDDAPFSWAIRQGRQRVLDDPDTPGFHRVFSYVERGFYGAQLARALSIFPAEQILNLRSEDLDEKPTETMRLIAHHLGLRHGYDEIAPLRANVGVRTGIEPSISGADKVLLSELYKSDLRAFAELSGLDVSQWL